MSAVTDDIEKALVDWVQSGSGLARDHIIWEQERGPQPNGCYISMRISLEQEYGDDWSATELNDDNEIVYSSIGVRRATLTLQCFAAGDKWSVAKPDRRLASVMNARRLPSTELALRAAGVGFGPMNPVQSLNLERSQYFEPRALVSVILHLVSTVTEVSPWIECVEIEPTVTLPPDEELPTVTVCKGSTSWSLGFSSGFGG